jgi:hypothetical protein
MHETGTRGNVSTCQNSGEREARPEKVPRMVDGREWTKGGEGVCQKRGPDSLGNHCQGTQRTTGQGAEMWRSSYRHIPMLRRSANYRATEQGPAQGPARQPTGSRSHVRRRNHLRRRLMPRGRAAGWYWHPVCASYGSY